MTNSTIGRTDFNGQILNSHRCSEYTDVTIRELAETIAKVTSSTLFKLTKDQPNNLIWKPGSTTFKLGLFLVKQSDSRVPLFPTTLIHAIAAVEKAFMWTGENWKDVSLDAKVGYIFGLGNLADYEVAAAKIGGQTRMACISRTFVDELKSKTVMHAKMLPEIRWCSISCKAARM